MQITPESITRNGQTAKGQIPGGSAQHRQLGHRMGLIGPGNRVKTDPKEAIVTTERVPTETAVVTVDTRIESAMSEGARIVLI